MTAAMITTLFAGMTVGVSATGGTWAGSGSSADPYQIEDLDDLQAMYSTSSNFSGIYFELEDNLSIDLSTVNWTPIGPNSKPFAGTFDGNGKTITWSGSTTGQNYYGIFGKNTGTVKNLTTAGSLTVTGSYDYIAPVVGYNTGTIDHVTNTANLTASNAFNIGGIAGFNNGGYILNSSNSGVINGHRKLGGIVGENDGIVNSCSNTGAVSVVSNYSKKNGTGGIAGLNGDKDTPTKAGHIWNCYNTADIDGNNSSWVGGICGFENELSDCVNCYNTGEISGYDYLDNISGKTEGSNYNCYGLPASVTNAEYYDGATILSYVSDMETDDFLEDLSFNATAFWTRSTGLPYLTNIATTSSTSPASGITITMFSAPFQTTYNVGDVFSDAGMIIRANGSDGSVAQVTNYTISKTTALATSDNSIVISGSYNGTSYSFPVAITVTNPSTIYLNTAALTNGDGSSASPYNTLSAALAAANAGDKIALMNTVTLNSAVTMHNNVSFIRASGFTGTMFEIDPGSGNLVRLTTMRIDGAANGTTTPTGTLFNVTSGILNLRGGIILKNGVTGVNVGSGGTLEVNKALISASTNSIVNAGNLTISDYGGTTINGAIYLASGKYITLGAAVPSNGLLIDVSDYSTVNREVARGNNSHDVDDDDAKLINTLNDSYVVVYSPSLSALILGDVE